MGFRKVCFIAGVSRSYLRWVTEQFRSEEAKVKSKIENVLV